MLMHFPTLENIYAACQKRIGTDTCLGIRADFEDCVAGEVCELSYDSKGKCLGGTTVHKINLSGSRDNIVKSIENALKNIVHEMNGEKIDALVLVEGTHASSLEGTDTIIIYDAVMIDVWKDLVSRETQNKTLELFYVGVDDEMRWLFKDAEGFCYKTMGILASIESFFEITPAEQRLILSDLHTAYGPEEEPCWEIPRTYTIIVRP